MAKKTKAPSPAKPVTDEPELEPAKAEEQPLAKSAAKLDVPVAPTPTVVKSSPRAATRGRSWIWMTAVGVVVLVGAVVVGWKLFGGSNPNSNTNTADNSNSSGVTLQPRVIDGVPVSTDLVNTNIYAVVIENMVDSRPPSSLDKASVVYETLAEGGITRFLALFPLGDKWPELGPVRSARPYFVSWAQEYGNPLFVHAGGSPEALALLRKSSTKVVDFNQFSHGGNFIRDSKRSAPHNLYTNDTLLYTGLRRTELRDAVPSYSSWLYKGEAGLDARPSTTNSIVINFSSFNYKVSYTYDRVQNQYQRFVADKAHVTRTGDQIYAKNIAVEFTDVAVTQNNKGRMDIRTTGTGRLLLFRDGTVTEGTWKKSSDTARTEFLDASGNPLSLNAGSTWIEVVSTGTKVTY